MCSFATLSCPLTVYVLPALFLFEIGSMDFWTAAAGASPCAGGFGARLGGAEAGAVQKSGRRSALPLRTMMTTAVLSWPVQNGVRKRSSLSLATGSSAPPGAPRPHPTHCPGSPASPPQPSASPPIAYGVGWRADRLDEMHPRPPCCVSKKGWSCAMCHQTPPSLHTNPPALRHPMCTTAPRRFPAPVDPWPPFLPAHTVAPLIRPHPLRASRGAVVSKSGAQCVAAFWEPCGRTPESHR